MLSAGVHWEIDEENERETWWRASFPAWSPSTRYRWLLAGGDVELVAAHGQADERNAGGEQAGEQADAGAQQHRAECECNCEARHGRVELGGRAIRCVDTQRCAEVGRHAPVAQAERWGQGLGTPWAGVLEAGALPRGNA